MDCILHIGIGKAGSSTIQGALQQGRAQLRERGILYPEDLMPRKRRGGDNQKALAVAAMDAGRTNLVLKQHGVLNPRARADFDGQVLRLYREQVAASWGARCLLSAEHFWSVLGSSAEIARLVELLRRIGLGVSRIVVYLRRQSDWFESVQYQRLREGHVRVETAAERILAGPAAVQLDYAAVLEKWQAAFPDAQMVPRLFEKSEFAGGTLLGDFWDATGVDGSGIAAPVDRNVSAFSNLGVNALIAVNHLVPVLQEDGRLNLARKDIASFIATRMSGRVRVIPPEELAAIDAHYAATNEAVRRRYFPGRATLFPPPARDTSIETYTPINDENFIRAMQMFAELWNERAAAAAAQQAS